MAEGLWSGRIGSACRLGWLGVRGFGDGCFEEREGELRLDRGVLVALQRPVEPAGLEALVRESLDDLVVDQPVDRLAAELVIGLVHGAAELRPPVGRHHRELT